MTTLNTKLAVAAFLVVAGLQWFTIQKVDGAKPEVLEKVALNIKRHDQLLAELRVEQGAADKDALRLFLERIRRDGFADHVKEKRILDLIVANLQETSALLDVYSARNNRDAFRQASRDFQAYSLLWQQRFNSIFGIYLLGGELPREPLVFPVSIRDAVSEEGE